MDKTQHGLRDKSQQFEALKASRVDLYKGVWDNFRYGYESSLCDWCKGTADEDGGHVKGVFCDFSGIKLEECPAEYDNDEYVCEKCLDVVKQHSWETELVPARSMPSRKIA